MPNWCSTALAVTAKADDKEAYSQLMALRYLVAVAATDVSEDADIGWVGFLLKRKGISPDGLSCRSFIHHVDMPQKAADMNYILVELEEAWTPHLDVWDKLLALPEFSKLSYRIRAEEPACGVLISTDTEGAIFPERYILDYGARPRKSFAIEYDHVYYETVDKLLADVKRIFGIKASNWEDLRKKVARYEETELRDFEYINIYQFNVGRDRQKGEKDERLSALREQRKRVALVLALLDR